MRMTFLRNLHHVINQLIYNLTEPCIFAAAVYAGSITELDLPTIISVTAMIRKLTPGMNFVPEFIATWEDGKKQMKRV